MMLTGLALRKQGLRDEVQAQARCVIHELHDTEKIDAVDVVLIAPADNRIEGVHTE